MAHCSLLVRKKRKLLSLQSLLGQERIDSCGATRLGVNPHPLTHTDICRTLLTEVRSGSPTDFSSPSEAHSSLLSVPHSHHRRLSVTSNSESTYSSSSVSILPLYASHLEKSRGIGILWRLWKEGACERRACGAKVCELRNYEKLGTSLPAIPDQKGAKLASLKQFRLFDHGVFPRPKVF